MPPPGGRHHVARRQYFEVGEPLAAGFRLHHGRDHVLAGTAPTLVDALHEIGLLGVENFALLPRHCLFVGSNRLEQKIGAAVAPVPHQCFIGIRQPEKIEHHLGRNPRGEIEIGVERVALLQLVEQHIDPALQHRPQAFDRARRHGFQEQRLQAVVIGVVAVEEPAMIMLDDVAEALGIGARKIGVERLDAIDA